MLHSMPLHALFKTISDFLAPPTCCACEKPMESFGVRTACMSEKLLCAHCTDALRALLTPQPHSEHMPPVDVLYAPFYNIQSTDLPARLVKWMKYCGNEKQAAFFANFFAGYMLSVCQKNEFLNKNFVLCPVPLHPLRERHRGFNQSALLASAIYDRSHIPFYPLLKRHIYTPTQTSLTKSYRIKNMFNVFSVTDKKMAHNQNVLLIDDLCTTGSTLREAAKTLKTEGCPYVAALVVGRINSAHDPP